MLNAAARLTAGVCKFDHVTTLLTNLYCLYIFGYTMTLLADTAEELCDRNTMRIYINCVTFLLQVRFAALKVIEEMSRKLGDSYKVVLPETIVTLTELNEGKLILYAVTYL